MLLVICIAINIDGMVSKAMKKERVTEKKK